jgi:hypothetical protein
MAAPKKKTKKKADSKVRPDRFGGTASDWIVTKPTPKP